MQSTCLEISTINMKRATMFCFVDFDSQCVESVGFFVYDFHYNHAHTHFCDQVTVLLL